MKKLSLLIAVVFTALLLPLAAAIPLQASQPSRQPPLNRAAIAESAVQVVAAGTRTCALTSAGEVLCWGEGYLGNGPWSRSVAPVYVAGLRDVTALAAGYEHTCALLRSGRVRCWGGNWNGQLGDGTVTMRLTPVEVAGLTGAVRLAAGNVHTCAVTDAGELKCWGSNENFQLGTETITGSTTPVTVTGLTSGVTSVAAGYGHTCAAVTAANGNSGAWCWGINYDGQLGDGTTTNHPTATPVNSLGKGVVEVTAGYAHSCALLLGGELKCWGANESGQLGAGTRTGHLYAVNVVGLNTGVLSVSAAGASTCAVTGSGGEAGVKCWGNNRSGQVGDGTSAGDSGNPPGPLAPVQARWLTSGVASVSAGGGHTCAVMTDGGIKCWGDNNNGQLGQDPLNVTALPVEVPGIPSTLAAKVAAGRQHACALVGGDSSGYGVKCWGDNRFGQLGDGTTISRFTAAYVSGLSHGVRALAAGGFHTCAVLESGAVKCWGSNGYGEIGTCGSAYSYVYPVDVAGLSGALFVTAGTHHTCVQLAGQVKCWGNNEHGELGNGTTNDSCGPKAVASGGVPLSNVTAGGQHTCAVKNTATGPHTAVCWGANDWGQLGDGTTTQHLSPVEVQDLGEVEQISGGGGEYWYWSEPSGHTCAVLYGGTVKCWGANRTGQLGDGTATLSRTTPVPVVGLTQPWSAWDVKTGQAHTCALVPPPSPIDQRWGMKCWGSNSAGQLGDGTTGGYRDVPQEVDALAYRVESVDAGANHTCAVMTNGRVACWGSNDWGQTGANPGWAPLDVPGFGAVPAYTPTPTDTTTVTPTPTTITPSPSPTPGTLTPTPTASATPTPTPTATTAVRNVWLPILIGP